MSWTVRRGVALAEQIVLEMMPEGSTAIMDPVIYCPEEELLHVTAHVLLRPIFPIVFSLQGGEDFEIVETPF